jgi:hypothetical protein
MSLEMPCIEQMLYAQLATLSSLGEYIEDNCRLCDFKDAEILRLMELVNAGMRLTRERMVFVIKAGESYGDG